MGNNINYDNFFIFTLSYDKIEKIIELLANQ